MLGWRKGLKMAARSWRFGTAQEKKNSLTFVHKTLHSGHVLFLNPFDSAGSKLQPGGEGQSV